MTAKPKPPATVEVGSLTYTIDFSVEGWSDAISAQNNGHDPEDGRYYGFHDASGCNIWINPHATIEIQRESLLHEVMHACQFVACLPNRGKSSGEAFISRLSPVLIDTLRRNPDLARFLLG